MNIPPDIEEAFIRAVRGTASESERQTVEAWRSESVAHEEYYRELAWLAALADDELARGGRFAAPAVEALIDAAERRQTGKQVGRPLPRRGRGGVYAAAATIALLIGVVALGRALFDSPTPAGAERAVYRTGPSEQRTVELEDGTLVHLAAATTLSVYGDPSAPRMWLEGRAFFGVPKKEDRRIVIGTSAGSVTVLGTRFDLRSMNGDLQLMVVDGRVSVTAGGEEAGIGSGEIGLVNSGDLAAVVRVEDPFEYLAWMESAMVFQATPFARAAEEIAARYDVTFDIRDPGVMPRTITTSFRGSGLEEVLTVLCGVVQARCVVEGATVTVTSL